MITININENTPYEVLQVTSLYLKQLATTIHGEPKEKQYEMELAMPDCHPVPASDGEVVEAPVVPAPPSPSSLEAEGIEEALVADQAKLDAMEVDANGLPWDERIHASTKTKVASGEWKRRRGVSDTLVRQVEAELRNGQADVVPAAPMPPAPTPEAEPEAEAAPVVPTPAVAVGRSYSELVAVITKVVTADVTKHAKVLEVVKSHGFDEVPALQSQEPEVIGKVYADIEVL